MTPTKEKRRASNKCVCYFLIVISGHARKLKGAKTEFWHGEIVQARNGRGASSHSGGRFNYDAYDMLPLGGPAIIAAFRNRYYVLFCYLLESIRISA
jgi:hypothetical protein